MPVWNGVVFKSIAKANSIWEMWWEGMAQTTEEQRRLEKGLFLQQWNTTAFLCSVEKKEEAM